MLPRLTTGFRPRNRVIVDCAYCPTARRCWDEAPLPGTDLLVQPELRLERGAILTLPSGPPRIVFMVISGCLALSETEVGGTRHTAGFRLPGELVGPESWARADRPYEVRAATASVVCHLTLPRIGRGRGNSAFLERLLVKSAAQIDRAMRPWPGLPAIERVAAFVEDFVERAQVRGSSIGSVRLPMTRADIGSYLGLSEETVVRALARLKRGRRLEVHGRMVGLVQCSRPCAQLPMR
jgi:CRP/FNR family transcriptional regulator, anaerobic regulatory protein